MTDKMIVTFRSLLNKPATLKFEDGLGDTRTFTLTVEQRRELEALLEHLLLTDMTDD